MLSLLPIGYLLLLSLRVRELGWTACLLVLDSVDIVLYEPEITLLIAKKSDAFDLHDWLSVFDSVLFHAQSVLSRP